MCIRDRLQTTERTELTGKEGIPFQEGTQNGHMLLEKIKEYISSDVYICPGAFQTTEGWSTTDVESIVGNWDEFTKAVLGRKAIITSIYSQDAAYTGIGLTAQAIEGYALFIMVQDKYFAYLISEDLVILLISDTVLFANSVVDNLNSLETKQPLSANPVSYTHLSGATSQTYALAHNNSTVWGSAKSVTIRCTSGGVSDEMTIAKVSSCLLYTSCRV